MDLSAVTDLILAHPFLFTLAVIIALVSYIQGIYVALNRRKK